MVLQKVEPDVRIAGVLQANLTDYQSGRTGRWVWAGRPDLEKLINDTSNFPLISVESMGTNTLQQMGTDTDEVEDKLSLLINVWCVRKDFKDVISTTDESHTFATGTDEYTLTNIPASSISSVTGTLSSVAHTFVKDTDYQIYDNDGDGLYDSIQWLGVDTPDNSTTFLVTYARILEGQDLANYIALEAHIYLRDNWKDDLAPILYNYVRSGWESPKFEQGIGLFRKELKCDFKGLNIGD